MDEIAADTLLVNGRIITLDPGRPAAAALAIGGERILEVGSRADLTRWRDRRTRVIDLTDNKPADPWLAFRAAVDRRDMSTGVVLGSAERLTRAQALRALTVGGGWLGFAERERGTLAPGRLADLAVLDRDPLTAPLDSLDRLRCSMTMVGGRVIHSDA